MINPYDQTGLREYNPIANQYDFRFYPDFDVPTPRAYWEEGALIPADYTKYSLSTVERLNRLNNFYDFSYGNFTYLGISAKRCASDNY